MENKFKLGQKVREKNKPVECAFLIKSIFEQDGGIFYGCRDEARMAVHESELELVKEKKKVSLFAPVRKSGNLLELGIPYYNNKSFFKGGDIVGWHELAVEVDDE